MLCEIGVRPVPQANRSIHLAEDRLRFLTQHLYDLQSLRWLPAQCALIATIFLTRFLFNAVADYMLLRRCARYPLEEPAHG